MTTFCKSWNWTLCFYFLHTDQFFSFLYIPKLTPDDFLSKNFQVGSKPTCTYALQKLVVYIYITSVFQKERTGPSNHIYAETKNYMKNDFGERDHRSQHNLKHISSLMVTLPLYFLNFPPYLKDLRLQTRNAEFERFTRSFSLKNFNGSVAINFQFSSHSVSYEIT